MARKNPPRGEVQRLCTSADRMSNAQKVSPGACLHWCDSADRAHRPAGVEDTPAHTAAVCACRPKLRRRPTPRRPAACPRRGRRHSSTPQRTEIMGKPRLVVRADRPDKAVVHQLHPGAAPRATPCAAVRYRRLAPIYDFVNSSSRLPFAALPGPPRSLQQPPMRLLCSFLASVPRGQ